MKILSKHLAALSAALLSALLLAAPSMAAIEITGPYDITETDVEFASRDVMLTGILTVPQTDGETYPMAILTHGFLANVKDCEHIAHALGKNGIASIRINLMGSGTSGGLYEDSDFTTQKEDILNALAYAKTLPITDTKNLFLCGKSQGGFDSALAALDCEDEINAMCLWFPAFTIPDDFRSGKVLNKTIDLAAMPDKVEMREGYAVSRAMIEQGMSMSIEEIFPHFGKDVLLIHGDKDPLVSISYSETMSELYPSAELIVIKGGSHGFGGQNELDALTHTVDFIKAHIVQ